MPADRPGLHKLADQELKRLMQLLYREALPSPVSRSALIEAAFGHVEEHLDDIVGSDRASALKLIAALIMQREARPEVEAQLCWCGPLGPGTRSRDVVRLVHDLIDRAEHHVSIHGLRLPEDAPLVETLRGAWRARRLDIQVILQASARPSAEQFLSIWHPEGRGESPRRTIADRSEVTGSPGRDGLQLATCEELELDYCAALIDGHTALLMPGPLHAEEGQMGAQAGFEVRSTAAVRALEREIAGLKALGKIRDVPCG